jgi:sec-independent protein translocase protein TatA
MFTRRTYSTALRKAGEMGELSPWHWLIVIGVVVLLFGAKRLPDAARSLGRSARILRAELQAGTAPTATEPDAGRPEKDPTKE